MNISCLFIYFWPCAAPRGSKGGHQQAIRRRGDIFTASKGKTQESVITGICNQMRTRRAANNRRSHNVVSSRSLLVPQTFGLSLFSLLPLSSFSLFLAFISPFVSAWVSPRKKNSSASCAAADKSWAQVTRCRDGAHFFCFLRRRRGLANYFFFRRPFLWPQP